MADIATLGLAVDSRPVTAAVKELDKLAASGKKAEEAAKGLQKTAGPGLGAVEAAAKRAGVSIEEFRGRMATASVSVARNFPQMGKAAADAAKGVTTLTDALGSKGDTGVTEAATRAERSTSNLANTLTRRFIIGYAVSQVRSLGTAVAGLNAEMARVGDIGKLTGMGNGGVQGITAAAGNKGIAGDAMASALVAFNQQIPTAKEGIGSLGALLRANKVTVTDTNDAFFKVADLVQNAANDTARMSILQQAGLPATLEMVRLMEQGSAAIKSQANDAPKFSDAQIEAARKIESRWNEMWSNFTMWGKKAAVEVATAVGQIATHRDALRFEGAFSDVGAGSGSGALRAGLERRAAQLRGEPVTRDTATLKAIQQETIQKASVRVGLVGRTPTAAEIKAAKNSKPESNNDNDCDKPRLLKAA